jgi:hypothetical protein
VPRNETKKGSWEKIKVHGKSLEGNLEGDSPDRVVYFLHGYAAQRRELLEHVIGSHRAVVGIDIADQVLRDICLPIACGGRIRKHAAVVDRIGIWKCSMT